MSQQLASDVKVFQCRRDLQNVITYVYIRNVHWTEMPWNQTA